MTHFWLVVGTCKKISVICLFNEKKNRIEYLLDRFRMANSLPKAPNAPKVIPQISNSINKLYKDRIVKPKLLLNFQALFYKDQIIKPLK